MSFACNKFTRTVHTNIENLILTSLATRKTRTLKPVNNIFFNLSMQITDYFISLQILHLVRKMNKEEM